MHGCRVAALIVVTTLLSVFETCGDVNVWRFRSKLFVVVCALMEIGKKKSDFVKSNLLNTHYRVLPCESDGARLTFHSHEKDRFIACILKEQNFLGKTT